MNGSEIFISLKTRGMQGRNGGAEEDRTPDLRIANATLSQLSYGPTLTTTDSETRNDTVDFISRFLLLSTF